MITEMTIDEEIQFIKDKIKQHKDKLSSGRSAYRKNDEMIVEYWQKVLLAMKFKKVMLSGSGDGIINDIENRISELECSDQYMQHSSTEYAEINGKILAYKSVLKKLKEIRGECNEKEA